MKPTIKTLILAIIATVVYSCKQEVTPPQAVGPIPSERQLAWQELEYYAFIHFNMNTFTDMEWGLGGESPKSFNPTDLDVNQWVSVAKEAGMKGIIITAKHHDGFCLWPTETTEHSIKNAPYKNGKGDLIKELSEACKEGGLKFGVYLSPWDRNNEHYGNPEYVEIFHEQLRELLTNYGDIFEVWFDGANGGSGYYGGANETRKIDNKTYYEWDKAVAIVRELQPNAVIFSDGGPDVRWVGNEDGKANATNWSIMRRDEIYPGWPRYKELRGGHEDGTHWLPAEADVSIRPGWYYHASEDHQVKTLEELIDIYYKSVGRNASFLLNLPVDKRGLVHELDEQQLIALRKQLDKDFAENLALNTKVVASNYRGNDDNFRPELLIDDNKTTYWATDNEITEANVIFSFSEPTAINRIVLQEYIPLGQRVQNFTVEVLKDNDWETIVTETTIGYKRILRFDTQTISKLRVSIQKAKGAITLSNVELYKAPNLLVLPTIKQNKEGVITMHVPDENISIFYTLDGSTPTKNSIKYEKPFVVQEAKELNVIAVNTDTNEQTEVKKVMLEYAKKKWEVFSVTSGKMEEATKFIDNDPATYFSSEKKPNEIQSVTINLGEKIIIKGFTYTPMQARFPNGLITDYTFSVSEHGKKWKEVYKGEFGNIQNNRIKQQINFNPVEANYIKLIANKTTGEGNTTTIAEIGVIKVD
ncbi:alpha-L-fucosidase [Joostella atrarenae]|uniref:alpha-L-fucosidase n=1 Tax=Joostella atrarenae TaxID=679257 RepID=A0ABS9J5A1_9FLAO|nr:alpha-L-fucosidase [Joostella atrarenae]MCF8715602.1 alpha-L-fucosidase [Joostella atrarenae]